MEKYLVVLRACAKRIQHIFFLYLYTCLHLRDRRMCDGRECLRASKLIHTHARALHRASF